MPTFLNANVKLTVFLQERCVTVIGAVCPEQEPLFLPRESYLIMQNNTSAEKNTIARLLCKTSGVARYGS